MMSDLYYLLKGLIIGFSIAAPVGPIGILCIKRTITSGRLTGFTSGLGAATADAIYGSIAAFGLTYISTLLIQQQIWLRLIGGAFLGYLGIKTFFSVPVFSTDESQQRNLFNSYASTLFLTLTNPLTILFFTAIFAGLGIPRGESTYISAAIIVAGVFLGSACWWLLLSSTVHLLRNKFRPAGLVWVNRLSGLIIFSFGVLAIVGILFSGS